jgi:transposase
MECKRCRSGRYIKAGYKEDKQRYQCKDCKYRFTDTPRRGVHPVLKKVAILLYAHFGMSMSGIAKLMGVSNVAVLKWIRKFAESITIPLSKAAVVLVDEMWHFVNGKKNPYGSGAPLMGPPVKHSPGC